MNLPGIISYFIFLNLMMSETAQITRAGKEQSGRSFILN
jgi:hypothetical protein